MLFHFTQVFLLLHFEAYTYTVYTIFSAGVYCIPHVQLMSACIHILPSHPIAAKPVNVLVPCLANGVWRVHDLGWLGECHTASGDYGYATT